MKPSLAVERLHAAVCCAVAVRLPTSGAYDQADTTPGQAPTQAIPYFNILWASLAESELTIQYTKSAFKNVIRVAYINYTIEKPDLAADWISHLLDRAYGVSQRRKNIKVLVNPFGGSGAARKWFRRDVEPIFAAARCELDVEYTEYSGHAVEIAQSLDIGAFDVIVACSGDGLPHEIFNGLGRRKDAAKALASVAVAQIPCGTGNAMSWNLNGTDSPSMAALCIVKGLRTPLDLVSITHGDRRTLSFLSQAIGIVAEVDLGTENLRWMGDARFTYGFLVRLLGKTVYPCDIAVKVVDDDKTSIRARYRHTVQAEPPLVKSMHDPVHRRADDDSAQGLPSLAFGSVQDPLPTGWALVPHPTIGNFYAGNMAYMTADANFFQAALPADGCLDLVRIDGNISRRAAVSCLLAVSNNKLFDMEHVDYAKVAAFRVNPRPGQRKPGQPEGYISIDGEKIPYGPFQAEVHQGLGTVLSRSGKTFEAPRLE